MSEEVKTAAEKLAELTPEQRDRAAEIAGAYIDGLKRGLNMAHQQKDPDA